MQELEKILEEIEQRIEKTKKIIVEHPSDKMDEIANDTAEAFIEAYKECQDIIRKHMNDGWIPVEERLPTMEEYQKDDGRFILDDGNRRCAGYYDVYTGRFYSYRHITPYRAELYEDNRIIAWRPLPGRYRPERSETSCFTVIAFWKQ